MNSTEHLLLQTERNYDQVMRYLQEMNPKLYQEIKKRYNKMDNSNKVNKTRNIQNLLVSVHDVIKNEHSYSTFYVLSGVSIFILGLIYILLCEIHFISILSFSMITIFMYFRTLSYSYNAVFTCVIPLVTIIYFSPKQKISILKERKTSKIFFNIVILLGFYCILLFFEYTIKNEKTILTGIIQMTLLYFFYVLFKVESKINVFILISLFAIRLFDYFPVIHIELYGDTPFLSVVLICLIPLFSHYYISEYTTITNKYKLFVYFYQYIVNFGLYIYWRHSADLESINYEVLFPRMLLALTVVGLAVIQLPLYKETTRTLVRVFILLPFYFLLNGVYSVPGIFLNLFISYSIIKVVNNYKTNTSIALRSLIWLLLGHLNFFNLGKGPQFSLLAWNASSIGFPISNTGIGSYTVVLNFVTAFLIQYDIFPMLIPGLHDLRYYYTVVLQGTITLCSLISFLVHCGSQNIMQVYFQSAGVNIIIFGFVSLLSFIYY